MLINISDVSFFFKNEMIISFKYIFTSIDDKTTYLQETQKLVFEDRTNNYRERGKEK